jgi:alginate O-acetyltransferase complex protein AlgI
VALYIFSFPQIVSGPIDRFGLFAPQLRADGRSWEAFSRGAVRFMRGLCAKVLLADAIAPLANAAFALERPALLDAWLGSAAYTMQLFFDFAGYSDMAIGLGLMMGLTIAENFSSPYLSASVTEFWKRWHVSLSSWLRDYLYIPLGGSRHGLARTCLNLGLVMVLGGLWHGAALTFVLWGAWHGLLLVLERLAGARREPARAVSLPLPRPLGILLTMLAVNAGWVLFRAPDAAAALRMYAGMLGLHGAGLGPALAPQVEMLSVAALAAAFLLAYAGPWIARRLEARAVLTPGGARAAGALRLLIIPLFALAVVRVMAGSPAVFLYGKF